MGSSPSSVSSSPSPQSLPSISSSPTAPSTPQHQQSYQSSPPPHILQQQQSTQNIFGKYDAKELSGYDIPNAKKAQHNEKEIHRLFNEFTDCYSRYYDQREIQNKADIDLDKRKYISILVIIGSSIENSESLDGIYLKNAEDINSALFIRHFFHNVFGIPLEQILITSTRDSNFYYNDMQNDLISEPNLIFNGINDINTKSSNIDYEFEKKYEDEIKLKQNIIISQIGCKQYKFLTYESLSKIIKPFNINVINDQLRLSKNTNLLIFFRRSRTCW